MSKKADDEVVTSVSAEDKKITLTKFLQVVNVSDVALVLLKGNCNGEVHTKEEWCTITKELLHREVKE